MGLPCASMGYSDGELRLTSTRRCSDSIHPGNKTVNDIFHTVSPLHCFKAYR